MSKLGALAPKLGRPIKKKKRSNCRKTVFLKCQECGKYYEVPSYDKNKRKYYCADTVWVNLSSICYSWLHVWNLGEKNGYKEYFIW